jgi:hypothetical protein
MFGSVDQERVSLTNTMNRSESNQQIEMRRFATPTKMENGRDEEATH